MISSAEKVFLKAKALNKTPMYVGVHWMEEAQRWDLRFWSDPTLACEGVRAYYVSWIDGEVSIGEATCS